jgi:hypothetical protein
MNKKQRIDEFIKDLATVMIKYNAVIEYNEEDGHDAIVDTSKFTLSFFSGFSGSDILQANGLKLDRFKMKSHNIESEL